MTTINDLMAKLDKSLKQAKGASLVAKARENDLQYAYEEVLQILGTAGVPLSSSERNGATARVSFEDLSDAGDASVLLRRAGYRVETRNDWHNRFVDLDLGNPEDLERLRREEAQERRYEQ